MEEIDFNESFLCITSFTISGIYAYYALLSYFVCYFHGYDRVSLTDKENEWPVWIGSRKK